MVDEAGREAAGRPLRDIYTVALGIALVLAVEQVVDLEGRGWPQVWPSVLPFLAFVAVSFTLYHWASRFVDLSYAPGEQRPVASDVATMLIGTTELLLVIALSLLIGRPEVFLGGLAVLFAFEVLAGLAFTKSGAYATFADFGRAYLAMNALTALASATALALVLLLDLPATAGGVFAVAITWGRATAFYKQGYTLIFG